MLLTRSSDHCDPTSPPDFPSVVRVVAVDPQAASSRWSLTRTGVLAGVAFVTGLSIVVLLVAEGGTLRLDAMFTSIGHGDLRALRSKLNGLGSLAILALITLVLAHTVLPFPAELLAAAGGFALGVAVALPVLLASFVVSATLAYFIGAWLGRPVAGAIVGPARLRRAQQLVERGGAPSLLAIRLFPLLPFSPVCIACGLARVPLRRYLWTTALGMLPELALVSFIGSRLNSFSLSSPSAWAPLAGVAALVVLGPVLLRISQRSPRKLGRGRTSERADEGMQ
jgi:uncharacterized membrane protein YdjX (TVP38/TMEM64 family)